ncbi:hypothetical protein GCM10027614_51750 [Micromonospora vulcania]
MQVVERQRNYLRNPLPPGNGICAVCRSTAGSGFELCYQCSQHRSASDGTQADFVAPIAYSVARAQHDHNLIVYKSAQPSAVAMGNLSSLTVLYLARITGTASLAHSAALSHTSSRSPPHEADKACIRWRPSSPDACLFPSSAQSRTLPTAPTTGVSTTTASTCRRAARPAAESFYSMTHGQPAAGFSHWRSLSGLPAQ